MSELPPLPGAIADIVVPGDPVSQAAWRWAHHSLPAYLLAHSIRSYFWGAAIAAEEGWAFDRRILWAASLMHDVGLTTIPRNATCFEVAGAEVARRFLVGQGMDAAEAERAAISIVLHMQPGVTLDDGVESVLLDRATGLDVRGDGYELVDDVRPAVMRAYPRSAFDRRFLRAIEREVVQRPGCQSTRLLRETDLAGWMARSPWRRPTERRPR
ncbi:MAG TPA: HD domain-containing protein [Candidatus Saccharimonadia bacterium]|nr:HD domain-containing protein [Candidatus Saccharimonadia bacterium]